MMILNACSVREPKPIDLSVFNNGNKKVVIAEVDGMKYPKYQVEQADGGASIAGVIFSTIANVIANNANKEASEYVEYTNLEPTMRTEYYDKIAYEFEKRGIKVEKYLTPLPLNSIKPLNEGDEFSPFDFSAAKIQSDIDYALIAKPEFVGIVRFPGLFGESIKKIVINFYMVDLKNHALKGYIPINFVDKVPDDWDHPPYPLLTEGIKESLKTALNQAYEQLFSKGIK